MKTFQFPAGTTQISKKELKEAFSQNERVEIPGTVFRISARFDNDESTRFAIKELVLNEGIQSLILFSHKSFSVNVPKSLLEIETSALLPRVLCLPENFIRLNGGINGVEYLQAYGESEVRYCFNRNSKIRHYVLLGKKLTPMQHLFDYIPAGCVIHVESEKMGEKVLKRGGFDISEVYVIPDALEWTNFPADKLAMTAEEYDPESRLLPLQKELREEKLREIAEMERQRQQQERQRQKNRIISSMAVPVIKAALEPLCDSWTISRIDNDVETTTVRLSPAGIKWQDYNNMPMITRLELSSSTDTIAENAPKMAKVLGELKDFFQRNAQDMKRMKMKIDKDTNPRAHVDWNIFLATRCKGITIVATMNRDSIAEDSKVFATISAELDSIITRAKYIDKIDVEIS